MASHRAGKRYRLPDLGSAASSHVRYTDCNFSGAVGVHTDGGSSLRIVRGEGGKTVFSCDYNGWADMPEAEREAIEAFESAQKLLPRGPLSRECSRPTLVSSSRVLPRKAA